MKTKRTIKVGKEMVEKKTWEDADRMPTAYDLEEVVALLEEELKLADDEKARCIKENPMQFDEAKGYARGIATAIEIVKGGMKK